MALLQNTTFVVGISFVCFFGLLWYLGVHKLILGMLDARAEKIRGELDEARELREEARHCSPRSSASRKRSRASRRRLSIMRGPRPRPRPKKPRWRLNVRWSGA